MGTDLGTGRPRLVLRFAVASLTVFVAVGLGVLAMMVRHVRDRAEQTATFHAQFLADAVIAPALRGIDLGRPLSEQALAELDATVRKWVLTDGRDVRVKVWAPDATILYSDEPSIVGHAFPDELPELEEVLKGQVESGVSELDADENVAERPIADKLYQTYVPLRLEPGGPIVAVAELYQRYAVIQVDIDRLVRTLSITFGVGLVLLYAALLPIALRASRTLRRQNERLREQAEQLGVLLAREQETVAELRDLSQRKSDFVAAASHELRTPLTAILGSIGTLRMPSVSDDHVDREQLLAAAEQQARRLLRLISNLLSAAHLEEGTRPVVPEVVDLAQLIAEIRGDLPHGERRIRLELPPNLPPVTADREWTARILANLLDNALKFSAWETTVEVGGELQRDAVAVWVKDEGIGIDPADQERIFERFHQVDQSSTRRYGGVGLGLHLARELAEELGGEITVESAPGRGSIFTLTLPLAPPSGSSTPADATRLSASA
jgi:signal transduction histidine kinase